MNRQVTGWLAWGALGLIIAVPSADVIMSGSGDVSAGAVSVATDAGTRTKVFGPMPADPQNGAGESVVDVADVGDATPSSHPPQALDSQPHSARADAMTASDAPVQAADTAPDTQRIRFVGGARLASQSARPDHSMPGGVLQPSRDVAEAVPADAAAGDSEEASPPETASSDSSGSTVPAQTADLSIAARSALSPVGEPEPVDMFAGGASARSGAAPVQATRTAGETVLAPDIQTLGDHPPAKTAALSQNTDAMQGSFATLGGDKGASMNPLSSIPYPMPAAMRPPTASRTSQTYVASSGGSTSFEADVRQSIANIRQRSARTAPPIPPEDNYDLGDGDVIIRDANPRYRGNGTLLEPYQLDEFPAQMAAERGVGGEYAGDSRFYRQWRTGQTPGFRQNGSFSQQLPVEHGGGIRLDLLQ